MVSKDMITAGEFDKIRDMTKEAVTAMLGFELAHVGINAADRDEALQTAASFEQIFGFAGKAGNSSVFAGSAVEVMSTPGYGRNGHIAVKTNYIDRAVYHLGKQGVAFIEESAKRDAKGNLVAIYLEGEFGGFAVHLVQK